MKKRTQPRWSLPIPRHLSRYAPQAQLGAQPTTQPTAPLTAQPALQSGDARPTELPEERLAEKPTAATVGAPFLAEPALLLDA